MKALVTGGAGFIGSHLVDALLADGDRVHVVDDCSSGRLENLEDAFDCGVQLCLCDVTNARALTALMAAIRPDVVFHLAAQIDVRRSIDEPAFDAVVNIAGTVAALEAAKRSSARRFVLASTAAVYGEPAMLPTPEQAPLEPMSPYGAGKLAAESYLALYGRRDAISTVALRMANVYGPRQDPRGEAGVVAIFHRAACEGRPAVVFGDGSHTRDFVHVHDVAAAFLAAGRGNVTGAINVATGRELSVLSIAHALGAPVRHAPPRPGEVERSCLDPSAARLMLGWSARIELDEGLASLAPHRSLAGQFGDTPAVFSNA